MNSPADLPRQQGNAVALDNLPRKSSTAHDDLLRHVYCILGVPIDAIDMPEVLNTIELAAKAAAPFVISTPNINFLINSLSDIEFRESILLSDLCTVDGAPIVWIAKLLGIPIRTRVAGSDFFEALKSRTPATGPLRVFLFGTTDDVAAAAAAEINRQHPGMTCVGWICPGYEDVDELSQGRFIDRINASKADFLVVALGAKKGQLWLQKNHRVLRTPIRCHLGAVINYQAGSVKRAPHRFRRLGLEWLWRIKEEPYLWRRYWRDGRALLGLLVTRAIPLAIAVRRQRQNPDAIHDEVSIRIQDDSTVTLQLPRYATARAVPGAEAPFRQALAGGKLVVLDCSRTDVADLRFFGLLLMLRKQLRHHGASPRFSGVSPQLRRQFWLHGVDHLLDVD